jgi:DNA-binding transcriptional MerR regulator/GGDEF domain-containing protein
MDVRSKPTIQAHLRKEDVQERILQYIQKGRDEATVTISRAAELFSITENKLRDWEEYGFLNPLRPSGPKGRRLYTPAELDKLAIIRELIDAGFSASDIPPDIYKQWHDIRIPRELATLPERVDFPIPELEQPINQRISQGRSNLFWHYFVSQTLRLALMLICEDIPNATAGLVLPLISTNDISTIQHVEDIPSVGESLIGWLSQSRSSHTLLTPKPSFQYSSDFRLERLQPGRSTISGIQGTQKQTSEDKTLIVIQREAKALTLTNTLVETIQHLLQPLYQNIEQTRACFGPGMRDVLSPATDLDSKANYEDVILNGLANMVIQMGGQTVTGTPRWHFSCIFTPNHTHTTLSLQQRSLVLRAQSDASPYTIGVTTHIPQEPFISSCIKAFQSGHNIYLSNIPLRDEYATTRQNPEGSIHSSIAVPIEGNDGIAIAVLYVASEQKAAFTEDDQRVLRILSRMIKEVLETYQVRLQSASNLRGLINHPRIVDTQFQDFLAEDDFIHYTEGLLLDVQTRAEFSPDEVVSFLAIDIDNHSNFANIYGDRIARDLSRAVGLRVHSQLRAFKDEAEYRLYHICADRFYILLHKMTLDQARTRAELLKQTLEGSYEVEPYHSQTGQPSLNDYSINMVTLSNLTVRLGVSSYPYQKLKEILLRYPSETAVAEVRKQITGMLEEELAQGKRRGGNIVMSWDPTLQGFVRLPLHSSNKISL